MGDAPVYHSASDLPRPHPAPSARAVAQAGHGRGGRWHCPEGPQRLCCPALRAQTPSPRSCGSLTSPIPERGTCAVKSLATRGYGNVLSVARNHKVGSTPLAGAEQTRGVCRPGAPYVLACSWWRPWLSDLRLPARTPRWCQHAAHSPSSKWATAESARGPMQLLCD